MFPSTFEWFGPKPAIISASFTLTEHITFLRKIHLSLQLSFFPSREFCKHHRSNEIKIPSKLCICFHSYTLLFIQAPLPFYALSSIGLSFLHEFGNQNSSSKRKGHLFFVSLFLSQIMQKYALKKKNLYSIFSFVMLETFISCGD